jgi:hypothetical protein
LKSKYKQWASGVRTFASTYVYRVLQFVTNPADVEYGSELQKSACDHLGIPMHCREDFWNEEGHANVEGAIRRKRGTLYNSLNLVFKRYCDDQEKQEGESILPPDPTDFIPAEMCNGEKNSGRWLVCCCSMMSNLCLHLWGDIVAVTSVVIGDEDTDGEDNDEEERGRILGWKETALSAGPGQDKYAEFLTLFGKCFVVEDDKHNKGSGRTHYELVSQYMPEPLEAFAVVLYANNHKKFLKQHWKGGDCDGDVSTFSSGGLGSFTQESRGGGKYSGWSDEGMRFYNRVFDVLEEQRMNNRRVQFEEKVRSLIQKTNSKKRKRKRAGVMVRNKLSKLNSLVAGV